MRKHSGICVCGGCAFAKTNTYKRMSGIPQMRQISDIISEQSRFKLARYIAVKELSLLYERAYTELGRSAAMIFYIHQLMLDDETFTDSVCSIIEGKKVNAEYAVYETCRMLANVFKDLDSGYMRERHADIYDVSERVIAILQNESQSFPTIKTPSILICRELSPSEILLPPHGMITGLVMTHGDPDSHASILAKKMQIPTLCHLGEDFEFPQDGTPAFLDADNCELYIDPDKGILEKFGIK